MFQELEGKRVRGPNGEIGRIVGGQIVVDPPQTVPPLRQVVAPQARQPAPVRPVQEALDQQQLLNAQLEAQRKQQEIAEAAAKQKPAKDMEDAQYELRNVIDAARRAKALSKEGWFTTGFGRSTAKDLGHTPPADLDAILNTIGANTAFSRLQKMREESPTGAALGNVTEMELKLLRDVVAGLDPNQSDVAFQGQMDRIIEHYRRTYEKAGGDMAAIGDAPGSGQPALPHEKRNELFQQKIRSGASYEEVAAYGRELGLEFDQEELKRAVGKKNAVVGSGPGLLSQLGGATVNTLAGIGQGVAAIPDAFANALSGTMALGAEGVAGVANALGATGVADNANWAADQWRNPITIGGLIEKAAPTPESGAGQAARFASQFTGGALGAPQSALTGLAERAVGKVPIVPRPALPAARSGKRIADDATALNIDVMPVVTGGPTTRLATAAAAQTPGGAYSIARGVERMTEGGSRALRNIASAEGAIANTEAAGQTAVRGAFNYRAASRTVIGRLYDRAANVAADARVVPAKAIQAIDDNLADLNNIPGGTDGAKYLQGLRDELTTRFPDGVTVQGIRGMRTQLRDKFYKDGLRGSDIERRVGEIVQSASDDIADSLTAAGKSEAADIYRQADAAWAARVDVLDNFLMPIIGKKGERSGEEVFKALQSAAKGNGVRLRGFIQALPEEEAGTVRASLISALGKPSSAAQDAEGAAFTFDGFLTKWNDMERTARNALFTGEGREAIDRLARISSEVKRAGRYANRSNTGSVGMTGLTVASGYAGFLPLVAALGTQYAAGRLLASPSVARALARVGSSKTPAESKSAIRSLSTVAARNPALASEITALQARLDSAFTSPATSAAAQENE